MKQTKVNMRKYIEFMIKLFIEIMEKNTYIKFVANITHLTIKYIYYFI